MKNYRILLREIREIKRHYVHGSGGSILVRSHVLDLICLFTTIPIIIPRVFFHRIDKLILKFIWKIKICRIALTILQRKIVLEE